MLCGLIIWCGQLEEMLHVEGIQDVLSVDVLDIITKPSESAWGGSSTNR